ncbi:hypothetical protein AB0H73_09715 [Streptomyces olivoreticuli]
MRQYILRVHFHLAPGSDDDLYPHLLQLLENITPRVQPVEPDAVDCDVAGAQTYFRRGPHDLAQLIRLRTLALHGVRTTIGGADTKSTAAMALDATAPGNITCIDPGTDATTAFLRPRPIAALYGIGPATAATLSRYGITTTGQLADTPLLTVQKILGTATGRLLHERARGIDPRPVIRQQPARSCSAALDFPHDELDPHRHRQALLHLAEQIGFQLRADDQVCRRLALSVKYADGTATHRTRTLPEASSHSAALAHTAYDLHAALALQRARVTGLALRAEELGPAATAHHQLTFDPGPDKARQVEAAVDIARARFGPTSVTRAALADLPARPYGDTSRPTPRQGRGRLGTSGLPGRRAQQGTDHSTGSSGRQDQRATARGASASPRP